MRLVSPKNKSSNAADLLAAQIAAIRDECHETVKILSTRRPSSNAELAQCVYLGDKLDATNRFLKSTVAQMAILRRKRRAVNVEQH
jgi:hypothetical protein